MRTDTATIAPDTQQSGKVQSATRALSVQERLDAIIERLDKKNTKIETVLEARQELDALSKAGALHGTSQNFQEKFAIAKEAIDLAWNQSKVGEILRAQSILDAKLGLPGFEAREKYRDDLRALLNSTQKPEEATLASLTKKRPLPEELRRWEGHVERLLATGDSSTMFSGVQRGDKSVYGFLLDPSSDWKTGKPVYADQVIGSNADAFSKLEARTIFSTAMALRHQGVVKENGAKHTVQATLLLFNNFADESNWLPTSSPKARKDYEALCKEFAAKSEARQAELDKKEVELEKGWKGKENSLNAHFRNLDEREKRLSGMDPRTLSAAQRLEREKLLSELPKQAAQAQKELEEVAKQRLAFRGERIVALGESQRDLVHAAVKFIDQKVKSGEVKLGENGIQAMRHLNEMTNGVDDSHRRKNWFVHRAYDVLETYTKVVAYGTAYVAPVVLTGGIAGAAGGLVRAGATRYLLGTTARAGIQTLGLAASEEAAVAATVSALEAASAGLTRAQMARLTAAAAAGFGTEVAIFSTGMAAVEYGKGDAQAFDNFGKRVTHTALGLGLIKVVGAATRAAIASRVTSQKGMFSMLENDAEYILSNPEMRSELGRFLSKKGAEDFLADPVSALKNSRDVRKGVLELLMEANPTLKHVVTATEFSTEVVAFAFQGKVEKLVGNPGIKTSQDIWNELTNLKDWPELLTQSAAAVASLRVGNKAVEPITRPLHRLANKVEGSGREVTETSREDKTAPRGEAPAKVEPTNGAKPKVVSVSVKAPTEVTVEAPKPVTAEAPAPVTTPAAVEVTAEAPKIEVVPISAPARPVLAMPARGWDGEVRPMPLTYRGRFGEERPVAAFPDHARDLPPTGGPRFQVAPIEELSPLEAKALELNRIPKGKRTEDQQRQLDAIEETLEDATVKQLKSQIHKLRGTEPVDPAAETPESPVGKARAQLAGRLENLRTGKAKAATDSRAKAGSTSPAKTDTSPGDAEMQLRAKLDQDPTVVQLRSELSDVLVRETEGQARDGDAKLKSEINLKIKKIENHLRAGGHSDELARTESEITRLRENGSRTPAQDARLEALEAVVNDKGVQSVKVELEAARTADGNKHPALEEPTSEAGKAKAKLEAEIKSKAKKVEDYQRAGSHPDELSRTESELAVLKGKGSRTPEENARMEALERATNDKSVKGIKIELDLARSADGNTHPALEAPNSDAGKLKARLEARIKNRIDRVPDNDVEKVEFDLAKAEEQLAAKPGDPRYQQKINDCQEILSDPAVESLKRRLENAYGNDRGPGTEEALSVEVKKQVETIKEAMKARVSNRQKVITERAGKRPIPADSPMEGLDAELNDLRSPKSEQERDRKADLERAIDDEYVNRLEDEINHIYANSEFGGQTGARRGEEGVLKSEEREAIAKKKEAQEKRIEEVISGRNDSPLDSVRRKIDKIERDHGADPSEAGPKRELEMLREIEADEGMKLLQGRVDNLYIKARLLKGEDLPGAAKGERGRIHEAMKEREALIRNGKASGSQAKQIESDIDAIETDFGLSKGEYPTSLSKATELYNLREARDDKYAQDLEKQIDAFYAKHGIQRGEEGLLPKEPQKKRGEEARPDEVNPRRELRDLNKKQKDRLDFLKNGNRDDAAQEMELEIFRDTVRLQSMPKGEARDRLEREIARREALLAEKAVEDFRRDLREAYASDSKHPGQQKEVKSVPVSKRIEQIQESLRSRLTISKDKGQSGDHFQDLETQISSMERGLGSSTLPAEVGEAELLFSMRQASKDKGVQDANNTLIRLRGEAGVEAGNRSSDPQKQKEIDAANARLQAAIDAAINGESQYSNKLIAKERELQFWKEYRKSQKARGENVSEIDERISDIETRMSQADVREAADAIRAAWGAKRRPTNSGEEKKLQELESRFDERYSGLHHTKRKEEGIKSRKALIGSVMGLPFISAASALVYEWVQKESARADTTAGLDNLVEGTINVDRVSQLNAIQKGILTKNATKKAADDNAESIERASRKDADYEREKGAAAAANAKQMADLNLEELKTQIERDLARIQASMLNKEKQSYPSENGSGGRQYYEIFVTVRYQDKSERRFSSLNLPQNAVGIAGIDIGTLEIEPRNFDWWSSTQAARTARLNQLRNGR